MPSSGPKESQGSASFNSASKKTVQFEQIKEVKTA